MILPFEDQVEVYYQRVRRHRTAPPRPRAQGYSGVPPFIFSNQDGKRISGANMLLFANTSDRIACLTPNVKEE
jgi:hypothetical protein